MHSEDFERILDSLAYAHIIRHADAIQAAAHYRENRLEIEREAAERFKRLDRDTEKPFTKLALASDPFLGIPVIFYLIVAFWVITEIVK